MRTWIHGRAVAVVLAAGLAAVAAIPAGLYGCSAVISADESGSPTSFVTRPVEGSTVRIDDPFWSPKFETIRAKTIPDVLEKFDRDGAMANFDLVRDGKTGGHRGQPWFDGLVYETIAGSADLLRQNRDPALEARLDAIIERIAAAAKKDQAGFINTYTTLMEPDHRWGLNGGNDRWQHDLYNVGCLIEAGVRYYRATGKVALLTVGVNAANLMCDVMGPPPKQNVIPGHALPEAAMLELHGLLVREPALVTKVPAASNPGRYLAMAKFWVDARGNHSGRTSYGSYNQDHAPVNDQPTIEGHAVRATLLGESIATLAGELRDDAYRATAERWWMNMVTRRMYITGGVGAVAEDEKFGGDFELPSNGYLETCGSVSAAFFHQRMNQLTGSARSADELERVLYNGVIGGVSHDGTHYFYENPLVAEAKPRWAWHPCPCCPPMLLKAFGQLPGMIYATDAAGVRVNLYIGSTASLAWNGSRIGVKQISQYPWRGESRLLIDCDAPTTFEVALRVPGWCQATGEQDELYHLEGRPAGNAFGVLVNGRFVTAAVKGGYARITREWRKGDRIDVTMDMPVRRAVADERLAATKGQVAITRGPLVYGVEAVDHGGVLSNLWLPDDAAFTLEQADDLGVIAIAATGRSVTEGEGVRAAKVRAIPYFAMANRAATARMVWLPRTEAGATPARPERFATPRASHVHPGDTVTALNDGREAKNSHDESIPRMTWWDHRGTTEWAEYAFTTPVRTESVRVYWWDERAVNRHCRVPRSWRVLYKTATGGWEEVKGASGYGVELDRENAATFEPIETTGLRIEAVLQEGWSGGILEWKVDLAK